MTASLYQICFREASVFFSTGFGNVAATVTLCFAAVWLGDLVGRFP